MAKCVTIYEGNQPLRIYGGPYRQRPAEIVGVKMAAEIDAPCTVSIPTKDYSIPDTQLMYDGLKTSLKLLRRHKNIYAGCMGGVGRTGFFMAIMLRILDRRSYGAEEAISRVRREYNSHAVETAEQRQFVHDFPVWKLRLWDLWYKFGL